MIAWCIARQMIAWYISNRPMSLLAAVVFCSCNICSRGSSCYVLSSTVRCRLICSAVLDP